MTSVYKGLLSQTFDANVAKFIQEGGRIQVVYGTTASHSRYEGNVIYLVDTDVKKTALATGVSYDQAYAEILVHELGHWLNATRDIISYGNISTISSYKDWFYTREAEAAIFGAVVTGEVRDNSGAFRVAGTSKINDLFTKVNSAWSTVFSSGNPDVLSGVADIVANYYANDANYRAAADDAAQRWAKDETNYFPAEINDSYSDYSDGCVEVGSILPCGRRAGDVVVGDELQLADERSLDSAQGTVSYSKRRVVDGYQIETSSGITLICSDTAPIPVQKGGMVRPAKLLNEFVAVRLDHEGGSITRWEQIKAVEPLGKIEVQHITVGDRSFWAGKNKGQYILHHNMKMVPGGGDDEWPWWDFQTVGNIPFSQDAPSGYFDEFGRPKIVLLIGSDS